MKDELNKLRVALKPNDNLLLAYLFGSKAKGKDSKVSDWDVAVLTRENSLPRMGEVLFAISKALSINEDK